MACSLHGLLQALCKSELFRLHVSRLGTPRKGGVNCRHKLRLACAFQLRDMPTLPQHRTWAALLWATAAAGSLLWPWAGQLTGWFVLLAGAGAVALASPPR